MKMLLPILCFCLLMSFDAMAQHDENQTLTIETKVEKPESLTPKVSKKPTVKKSLQKAHAIRLVSHKDMIDKHKRIARNY